MKMKSVQIFSSKKTRTNVTFFHTCSAVLIKLVSWALQPLRHITDAPHGLHGPGPAISAAAPARYGGRFGAGGTARPQET